jgi:hypothetical protein
VKVCRLGLEATKLDRQVVEKKDQEVEFRRREEILGRMFIRSRERHCFGEEQKANSLTEMLRRDLVRTWRTTGTFRCAW